MNKKPNQCMVTQYSVRTVLALQVQPSLRNSVTIRAPQHGAISLGGQSWPLANVVCVLYRQSTVSAQESVPGAGPACVGFIKTTEDALRYARLLLAERQPWLIAL